MDKMIYASFMLVMDVSGISFFFKSRKINKKKACNLYLILFFEF